MLDRDGRYLRINQALADMNGRPLDEQLGRIAWEIVPGLRQQTEAILHKVIDSGQSEVNEVQGESPGRPGGVRNWIQKWYPVRDADGRIVAAGATVEDVTERVAADRRHTLLMDELTHRVKNTLAVVQAMAIQTLRTTPDPETFSKAFSARLSSLARAHDLLTRGAWAGADLRDIVAAAVEPFLAGPSAADAGRPVKITGPSVDLPASTTITLTLMLHELATNAAKYGALSVPRGRVRVVWELVGDDGNRAVNLRWDEQDGPATVPPARQGFGSRLLGMGAVQLGGEINLDYAASGLRCRLRFPLAVA